MLDTVEAAEVAVAFGVADPQVRRDHLISHVLAGLAELGLGLTFFGGTALARTHLADPDEGARLSEDIDLYSPRRRSTAALIDERLPTLLRRDFPGVRWEPPLASVRSVDPAQLISREGIRVRVQLLDSDGGHREFAKLPTEVRPIVMRYRDLPATVDLPVPTLTAFAAMKTVAWVDRRAARDLYDLAGLSRLGALTDDTARLVHRLTGWRISRSLLAQAPNPDWNAQLAHQTRTLPTARQCLAAVVDAYARALGWPPA